MIRKCSCKTAPQFTRLKDVVAPGLPLSDSQYATKFQDRTYGVGNRIHTVSFDGKKFRCTVCGNEKTHIYATPKVEKKEKTVAETKEEKRNKRKR